MKTVFIKSVLLLSLSAVALQAKVTLNSTSYQEIAKVDMNGEPIREWVKATKIVPGTVIKYVNSLENSGSQTATKLVVNNPIPENMEYVANSAMCQSSCDVTYSVDGGRTFLEASELFVGEGVERHLAKASEYTNVRWVLDRLEGTSQSSVEYKARLK